MANVEAMLIEYNGRKKNPAQRLSNYIHENPPLSPVLRMAQTLMPKMIGASRTN